MANEFQSKTGGTVVLTNASNDYAGLDIDSSTVRLTANGAAGDAVTLSGTGATLEIADGGFGSSIEFKNSGFNKIVKLASGSMLATITGDIMLNDSNSLPPHADFVTGAGEILALSGKISGNAMEVLGTSSTSGGIVTISGIITLTRQQ